MIFDPWKLKKEADLLTAAGTILALHKLGTTLYLESILNDVYSYVFYSTNGLLLKKYLQSRIRLNQLFSSSGDFLVSVKSQGEVSLYIKKDIVNLIHWGDKLYTGLPDAFKNKAFTKTL